MFISLNRLWLLSDCPSLWVANYRRWSVLLPSVQQGGAAALCSLDWQVTLQSCTWSSIFIFLAKQKSEYMPTVSTVTGSRGFSYATLLVWNEIPLKICNSSSLASFKKHLKTHYFTCAFLYPTTPYLPPSICLHLRFGPSSWLCTHYKYCIVLYCIELHCIVFETVGWASERASSL